MTLLNPYFQDFDGTYASVRMPAALTVIGTNPLTDAQYAAVQAEYWSFCHDLRPTNVTYSTRETQLFDGSVMEVVNIGGRHEVTVKPAGGKKRTFYWLYPAFMYQSTDGWAPFEKIPTPVGGEKNGTWTDVPYDADAVPDDTLTSKDSLWPTHPGNCTWYHTGDDEDLKGVVLSWWAPGETRHGTWSDSKKIGRGPVPYSTDGPGPLKPIGGKLYINGRRVCDFRESQAITGGIYGAAIYWDNDINKYVVAVLTCGMVVVDKKNWGSTLYPYDDTSLAPPMYPDSEVTSRTYTYGFPNGNGAAVISFATFHAYVSKRTVRDKTFQPLQFSFVGEVANIGFQDAYAGPPLPFVLDGTVWRNFGITEFDWLKPGSISSSGKELFIRMAMRLQTNVDYDSGRLRFHKPDGLKWDLKTGKFKGFGPFTVVEDNGTYPGGLHSPTYTPATITVDGSELIVTGSYTPGYTPILYDYDGDTLHYVISVVTMAPVRRSFIYSSKHGVLFDTNSSALLPSTDFAAAIPPVPGGTPPIEIPSWEALHTWSIGSAWVYDLRSDYMVFNLIDPADQNLELPGARTRTVTVFRGEIIEDVRDAETSENANKLHRALDSSFDGRFFICTVGGAVRVYMDGVDITAKVENAANIKYPVFCGPIVTDRGKTKPPLIYAKGTPP